MNASVAAIVVTYRRPEMLRRSVAALLGQTRPPEVVLVVDNGGDVERAAFADLPGHERLTVVAVGHNGGPAGGFARGVAEALETNAAWCWMMDDDVIAEPDALERLLAAADPGAINWPRILTGEGEEIRYPGWSAVLVHRDRIVEAGLPRADLFWWCEDTEFLQARLQERLGMPNRRFPEALVHHLCPARTGPKPVWRYYYETRNSIFVRLHVKKSRYWKVPRMLARQVGIALRDREHVGPKLRLIGRGAWDGLRGRLGRPIDPATFRP